jgi:hypothetical protein
MARDTPDIKRGTTTVLDVTKEDALLVLGGSTRAGNLNGTTDNVF